MTVIELVLYEIQFRLETYWKWTRLRLDKNRIKVGDIYTDCSRQELVCVKADYYNDILVGKTWHGVETSCSFWHCGPEKLVPAP